MKEVCHSAHKLSIPVWNAWKIIQKKARSRGVNSEVYIYDGREYDKCTIQCLVESNFSFFFPVFRAVVGGRWFGSRLWFKRVSDVFREVWQGFFVEKKQENKEKTVKNCWTQIFRWKIESPFGIALITNRNGESKKKIGIFYPNWD